MKSLAKIKIVAFASVALIASSYSFNASAVPCVQKDTGIFTSSATPLSSASSDCWDGSNSNEGTTTLTLGGIVYDFLSKKDADDGDKITVDIDLTVAGGGTGVTNGDFSFTLDSNYTKYVAVLNDGGAVGTDDEGNTVTAQWSAYLLDLDKLVYDSTTEVYSGWWQYGYNTNDKLKEISHFSMFGLKGGDVPEPGMVGLLAIGLIGMIGARRKKNV